MLGEDVAFAGVVGQAEMVRRREVGARELVELALARIEWLNPELNAFGAVYGERARQEADAADARVAAGESAPLLGVPIGVKDEMNIAGEVTSFGTGAMVTPAAADAEAVRRARAAGAIVVGKTTRAGGLVGRRAAAGRPAGGPGRRRAHPSLAGPRLVGPTETFHRNCTPRMTAMRRPRRLAQRCCASAPASLPGGPRVAHFQAKHSGWTH